MSTILDALRRAQADSKTADAESQQSSARTGSDSTPKSQSENPPHSDVSLPPNEADSSGPGRSETNPSQTDSGDSPSDSSQPIQPSEMDQGETIETPSLVSIAAVVVFGLGVGILASRLIATPSGAEDPGVPSGAAHRAQDAHDPTVLAAADGDAVREPSSHAMDGDASVAASDEPPAVVKAKTDKPSGEARTERQKRPKRDRSGSTSSPAKPAGATSQPTRPPEAAKPSVGATAEAKTDDGSDVPLAERLRVKPAPTSAKPAIIDPIVPGQAGGAPPKPPATEAQQIARPAVKPPPPVVPTPSSPKAPAPAVVSPPPAPAESIAPSSRPGLIINSKPVAPKLPSAPPKTGSDRPPILSPGAAKVAKPPSISPPPGFRPAAPSKPTDLTPPVVGAPEGAPTVTSRPARPASDPSESVYTVSTDVPEEAPKVTLLFIRWSQDPANRVATVRADGGDISVVHEGDIFKGMRIGSIKPVGIEFQWRGSQFFVPAGR